MRTDFSLAPKPREGWNFILDKDPCGHREVQADIVTMVKKPVSIEEIGALSAKPEKPILFENIIENSGYRMFDIMLKHRPLQTSALGVSGDDYAWPVGRDHARLENVY